MTGAVAAGNVGGLRPLSASAAPTTLDTTGSGSSQTSGAATTTPAGGLAPFTYSWSVSTGGSGITIDSPSSASTTFSVTGLGIGATRSGNYLCHVTDALGAGVNTNEIAVSFERI